MPNNNGDITFKYGTQEAYNGLSSIDENAIYITTDTHRIYIGGADYTDDTQMNDATKQYVDSTATTVNSRIDNIIANNNKTEGNSELVDIRSGVNGTTYTSAGAAVRGQFELIINQIMDVAFDYVEVTEGLTVVSGGGLIIVNKQNNAYTAATLDPNSTNYSYTIGCDVTENEHLKVFCKSYANNYTGAGIVFSASESDIPVWTNSIPIIPTSNYDCFAGNTSSAWKTCEYEVTVPEGAKKVWIRGTNANDTKIYKKKTIYHSKIPTRTSELINDSHFVSHAELPVICFDFDQLIGASIQTSVDSRFTILKSYGFTGNVVESGNAEVTQHLVKMGFDISPYIGNHSTFDYANDSNGYLAQNITEKMERLESQGIYNPVMISCSGHRDAEILEEELDSEYNVKFIRARSFYKKDGTYEYVYPSGNSLSRRIVSPIIMEGGRTASSINSEIDNLVNNNVPIIMPMMHAFSSIGGSSDVTEETFKKVVAHVKELVDNGQALCMNMHEYYAYHYPEEAKQDDYVRIMSAVFDKEQVS